MPLVQAWFTGQAQDPLQPSEPAAQEPLTGQMGVLGTQAVQVPLTQDWPEGQAQDPLQPSVPGAQELPAVQLRMLGTQELLVREQTDETVKLPEFEL